MRRDRIQNLLSNVPVGRLLEIGPGAATLLVELSQKGFQCEALELSIEARIVSKKIVEKFDQNIPLHALPDAKWENSFDVLCAFEVLEHIDDDEHALAEWVSWLKPDGQLLLSVPAHMKLWNARDIFAGHFRRYERDSLLALLKKAGLEVEVFECYGFPLTNLIERVTAPIYARRILKNAQSDEANRKQNNDRSGIDRKPEVALYPLLRSLPGKWAIQLCYAIQNSFINTDLGSGYVIKAKRKC
ncbi:methyltransferase domain protein [Collimonas fungivorans]|uniref:Methyltransferase domain protein n=2 Tax=Collimonas fungivorans TaxID=158899 RepID=A0A127P7T1_9BURK|nr:methyltransferase domain protein [Collimonas fungivorans]